MNTRARMRLAALDGQQIAPPVRTVAFAFSDEHAAATINGKHTDLQNALIALIEMMNKALANGEALTARAVREPGRRP